MPLHSRAVLLDRADLLNHPGAKGIARVQKLHPHGVLVGLGPAPGNPRLRFECRLYGRYPDGHGGARSEFLPCSEGQPPWLTFSVGWTFGSA
jgi:hypothetical protein